jgi:hypothetical protein
MKIIISIIFSALLGAVMLAGPVEDKATELEFTNRFEKAEPCTLRIQIAYLITGYPSFQKDPCRGFGLRCLKLDKAVQKQSFSPSFNEDGKTLMLFEALSNSELKLTFNSSENTESLFIVDELTKLPQDISLSLGFNAISILSGKYPIKVNSDRSLSVVLKIKSN